MSKKENQLQAASSRLLGIMAVREGEIGGIHNKNARDVLLWRGLFCAPFVKGHWLSTNQIMCTSDVL